MTRSPLYVAAGPWCSRYARSSASLTLRQNVSSSGPVSTRYLGRPSGGAVISNSRDINSRDIHGRDIHGSRIHGSHIHGSHFVRMAHGPPRRVHNLGEANQGAPAGVGISAREAEVLAALGDHLTNAEIGARLFISIRTVESHVSSLLRKLRAGDRRELASVARTAHLDRTAGPTPMLVDALPSPLTPFVGRSAERAALSAALGEHRLVTAVGPGGIGKTRLAVLSDADRAVLRRVAVFVDPFTAAAAAAAAD